MGRCQSAASPLKKKSKKHQKELAIIPKIPYTPPVRETKPTNQKAHNMKYIIGSNSATVFTSRPITIQSDDPRWEAFVEAIMDNDENAVEEIAESNPVQTALRGEDGFEKVNDELFLDGIKLVGPLAEKIESMMRAGFSDLSNFVEFVRNIRRNPSRRAQEELYGFLEYKELPITERGTFLAYKGLQGDYFSVRGGTAKLISGRVNSQGQIYNGVGEDIEVERAYVDDDARAACSQGLHVGSYNYASQWGDRTVLVEVNPADIVSIPFDCHCQKARVCRYVVVSDVEREFNSPVVSSDGEVVRSDRDKVVEDVEDLLFRWENNGRETCTIKQIQSALKGKKYSVQQIKSAVNSLGYNVFVSETNPESLGAMVVEITW